MSLAKRVVKNTCVCFNMHRYLDVISAVYFYSIFFFCCCTRVLLPTVNFGSEMVQAKHVSGKNIFCSMNKEKIREERIFEIIHSPFEG